MRARVLVTRPPAGAFYLRPEQLGMLGGGALRLLGLERPLSWTFVEGTTC